MSQATVTAPATLESLATQFAALGLTPGRPVLVHTSLRRIGPVDGGADTVLAALRRVLGPGTSIVVPAQTPDNSTTSPVFRAATSGLRPEEVRRYIAGIEGFDPGTTPSFGMGALAERVRLDPAAVRSVHPQTSFAAVGPDAAELMRVHELESHLGDRSPLGALYRADGVALLLGVDYAACTAFHLAEYRMPQRRVRRYQCFVRTGGQRLECGFTGLDLDDSDFRELGAALELDAGPAVTRGPVGHTEARVLSIRRSVDFAVDWMARHR
jgi:aminoglycoside 3-N-acetyltransferase